MKKLESEILIDWVQYFGLNKNFKYIQRTSLSTETVLPLIYTFTDG